MLGGKDYFVDSNRHALFVFNSNLGLAIRSKVADVAIFTHCCELSCEFVRKRDRHWHKFRCFVACKTEHHTLIASSTGIYTHSDIG